MIKLKSITLSLNVDKFSIRNLKAFITKNSNSHRLGRELREYQSLTEKLHKEGNILKLRLQERKIDSNGRNDETGDECEEKSTEVFHEVLNEIIEQNQREFENAQKIKNCNMVRNLLRSRL